MGRDRRKPAAPNALECLGRLRLVGAILAGRLALRSARAVATRPRLWPTATALLLRFAPDGWWRRPPFVPLPPADLLRFRSETMYGDPAQAPSPADLAVWLEWCRAQRSRA